MGRMGKTVFCLAVVLLVGFGNSEVRAADADTMAREINTELRAAERQMHSGKHEEASAALEAIGLKLEALKAADARHRQLRSLESKFSRLKKDVERRTKKTVSTPSSGTAPREAAQPGTAGDKLPSGVTYRLKKINDALDGRRMREDPFDLMEEIETKYGGQYPADHPEIVAAKKRLAELEAERKGAAEAEAAATEKAEADKVAREAESAVWVKKLEVYTDRYDEVNSRVNPKYVAPTTTQDVKELKRLQENYDEASALFAEYKKVPFPHGKTRELQNIEETLEENLSGFVETQSENLARVAGRPMERIEELIAGLNRDTAWKTDPKAKPSFLRKDDLPDVEALIANSEKAIGKENTVAMRAKYAELVKMDQERRRVAAERTFMIADKFKGGEKKELKAKAEEIVRAEYGDAKVLRTTIISDDWKEEDVEEWTDTTKTAIRRRITRSVSGQVAAKRAGGVFLYTVHTAKDRRSDKTWGPLKGHIMFTDAMAEANVKK